MMEITLKLASRNIKVFLRDKTAVFFTFLSSIIIIVLYALFLGDNMVKVLAEHIPDINVARAFTDTWIMAGVLVVNSVTTTMGALDVIVSDEERGINRDFLVAPLKRWQLVAGYIIAAWAIGILMGVLVFAGSQAYIALRGGDLISITGALKVLGMIVLNVLSASSFNFLMVSFFRTSASYATFSTLTGTMIGFLTGVYVPLGILPRAVQNFVMLVPATHGASIMRRLFMAEPLEHMFSHVPPQIADEFTSIYGIFLKVGTKPVSVLMMLGYIALTGIAFFGISVLRMLRRKAG